MSIIVCWGICRLDSKVFITLNFISKSMDSKVLEKHEPRFFCSWMDSSDLILSDLHFVIKSLDHMGINQGDEKYRVHTQQKPGRRVLLCGEKYPTFLSKLFSGIKLKVKKSRGEGGGF